MDIETTRDGFRYKAIWHVEDGLLIVNSPLGSRMVRAAGTPEADRKRAGELLEDIVDDALAGRRTR